MARDEAGIEVGRQKRLMFGDRAQQAEVGGDANDLIIRQRPPHPPGGGFPVGAPDDQLGDHRVVERGDRIAFAHAGVDPDVRRFSGLAQMRQAPDGGQEVAIRIFGVNPCLDRVSAQRYIVLGQGQRFPRCDPQLPFHQIEASDHFGHRMLNLKPRVHFHEPEIVTFRDELDRSGTNITDRAGRGQGGVAHRAAAFRTHAGRGGLFQYFLMAALDGTITLEQ